MITVAISVATSVDGYLATLDGDSDWVLDDDLFDKTAQEYGCIVVGGATFRQYEGDLYPITGLTNLVLTHETSRQDTKDTFFISSVDEAIQKATELGHDKLLVVGGAKTNESFMRSGKVDSLFVDVHPLALGEGKRLLGDFTEPLQLKLTASKEYSEGFVHLEYSLKS